MLLQSSSVSSPPGSALFDFNVCVFVNGKGSLEPLLEGLLSQLHMDMSSRVSAGIEPGTCG